MTGDEPRGREPRTLEEFAHVLAAIFDLTGFTWGWPGEVPTETEVLETLRGLYDRVPLDADGYQVGTGRIELIANDKDLYDGDVRVLFDLGELPMPTTVAE